VPGSTAVNFNANPLLYKAELFHRMSNEYAAAISFVSTVASESRNSEVMSALTAVVDHLTQLANAHRVLSPPNMEGEADLEEYLARLCNAKVGTEFIRPDATLRLAVSTSVALDSARCWRFGLILSELITNAARGLGWGPGEGSHRARIGRQWSDGNAVIPNEVASNRTPEWERRRRYYHPQAPGGRLLQSTRRPFVSPSARRYGET
jgi:hypothetical protein